MYRKPIGNHYDSDRRVSSIATSVKQVSASEYVKAVFPPGRKKNVSVPKEYEILEYRLTRVVYATQIDNTPPSSRIKLG